MPSPASRLPLFVLALCCLASPAIASAQHPAGGSAERPASEKSPAGQGPAEKPAPPKPDLPPLPPDAHIQQSIHINGKALTYTVTVGTLPAYDHDGKLAGQVVYTSYIVDQPKGAEDQSRPVTFAFNGGPGASSVYLNLGAIGPRHVSFGLDGESPSDPLHPTDNPNTWLDFTDLVFIDPIGTGFSRALVPEAEAKKLFYGPDQDIAYLSQMVYDWLVKNGRLTSRKYLAGESYGGYRVPRLAHYLQTQIGVAPNGIVAISPALTPPDGSPDLSPIPWMLTLPSITAANYERKGTLSPSTMAPVIDYTRGQYAEDLLKGNSDPDATPRVVKKVTELTGLDPTFVRQSGGRLETQAFLREEFRETGKLGSRYDPNVTAYDPFPYDPEQRTDDPILESIIAPTTSAMVDFVTRVVGWKTDARYYALSYDVARAWDRAGRDRYGASASDLREAISTDPKLRVLIAHGWADLSCPFMGSVLTVSQFPIMGDPNRVQIHEYPGGHMFYARPSSQADLKKDAEEMFAKH